MSTASGTGRGGTALFASPGRGPRGVAFAPAVRGYPGGIADMASDLDELVAAGVGDGELWAIAADAGPGDAPGRAESAPDQVEPAGLTPGQSAPEESRHAQPEPAEPVSVWQQSAAAWQEARIDWLRPASPGAAPTTSGTRAASAQADPGGALPGDDDPHTEPIPAISADAPPGPAERSTANAGATDADAEVRPPGAASTDQETASEATALPGAAMANGTATTKPSVPGAAEGRASGAGDAARAAVASSTQPANGGSKGRAGRRVRRTAVVATAAVVLLAGAFAAVGIARSGDTGPPRPEFRLVTPYPPAVPADADFAGQAAGAAALPPSLTGIAAAGQTVVVIGAQASQLAPVPLILLSTDGGHTWSRATVTVPGAAGPGARPGTIPGPGAGLATGPGTTTGPGPTASPEPTGPGTAAGAGPAGPAAVPGMIAHGGRTWLALGPHTAWTSSDGRVWQPAPGMPEAAGDKVLSLVGTGTGFVAVGGHAGRRAGPVVWTSTDGRAWHRESGPELGITPRGGHVAALRWAAARGGVIVAGGQIPGARGRRAAAGVWRSKDGGRTWDQVTLPTTHHATSRLAGLAADGSKFLAVRPGRTRPGHQDVVAYLSAQGSRWSYAGKLVLHRSTSMRVTAVAGNSHGFAVAAVTRAGQAAFASTSGHGWHQVADPGSGIAGLTVGPRGVVVVAGNGQQGPGAAGIRPHLLLAGVGGRQQAGRSMLTAAATPDITLNALATAGPTRVAVGAAGGAPALWLASPGGRWAAADLLLPAAWRSGALLSVVRGGAGWLTVGQAGTQAPYQPVILTAASGTSWTPASGTGSLTAPGTSLAAAAAGPAGYVVVGSAQAGGVSAPAAWFSADLAAWARVPLADAAGGGQMLAVTAARPGFVAVGATGGSPVVWTSTGGSGWRLRALPRPAGAASAVLTRVTVGGDRIVAVGQAYRGTTASTPVPFAAVSADGGRTWRESVLPGPLGPAVVTALTAAGHGFVAVGHPGLPGQPGLFAWWSADGLTWHPAGPGGGGVAGPFVTQINAVIAGSGALTGAGFAVSRSAEHPVLWHARYR